MQENSDESSPEGPLIIAKQGYFYIGGSYFDGPEGSYLSGQMYVEYQIPHVRSAPWPIVLFSGGGQSGLNYVGTPDGREGWAQFFLRRGYAVYVLDQPARGRSPWHEEMGARRRQSLAHVQRHFTAPKHANLWPQARLHSQFPGTGRVGDPIFDQAYSQSFPSLVSFTRQQELNRDAGAALLDKIGPAILLTHSQSGTFGWLVADARPGLVKAIVAMEPSGPPVCENVPKGPPDWFEDGPASKPYGLTALPLTYDPPIQSPDDLHFVRDDAPQGEGLVRCWSQAEPARKLAHLIDVPVLVVQAEASYHAPYDHCTVAYLRQAGVDATFIRLADRGIHGNGHMLMMERNNQEIAAVAEEWLHATLLAEAVSEK